MRGHSGFYPYKSALRADMVRRSRASLNWRECRIVFLEVRPNPVGRHVQVVFRLTIGLWNDYFPEGRTNERKVILLIDAAAGTVGVPFMLNQSRTGHELQHFLFQICGIPAIWERNYLGAAVDCYLARVRGLQRKTGDPRRTAQDFEWSVEDRGKIRETRKGSRDSSQTDLERKCGRHRSSERFWSGPR